MQLAEFRTGLEDFVEVEDLSSGLGPVFNGRSCVECHSQGGVGGSSPDLGRSRVTRFARLFDGLFDPLENLGGSLVQARSVREVDRSIALPGERVPPEATLVSRRITTPLFGLGLIEAIPQSEILRRVGGLPGHPDGVAGAANWVRNPETGGMELGRFGWKANVSSIHVFAAGAYQGELGITNPTFPEESLPQGQPIPEGADRVAGLEDDGTGVDSLAAFMRYLAPPVRRPVSATARAGERVFMAIGCGNCHTPAMNTDSSSPIPAFRNRRVELWSDLLLHDMGEGLADGMVMGSANGRQWRTAPLWGLSARRFFLHDGRATTVDAAIAAHAGESLASAQRAASLRAGDRTALMEFLKSL